MLTCLCTFVFVPLVYVCLFVCLSLALSRYFSLLSLLASSNETVAPTPMFPRTDAASRIQSPHFAYPTCLPRSLPTLSRRRSPEVVGPSK